MIIMIISRVDVSFNVATVPCRWQPACHRRPAVGWWQVNAEHLIEVKCLQWHEEFRNKPYFLN